MVTGIATVNTVRDRCSLLGCMCILVFTSCSAPRPSWHLESIQASSPYQESQRLVFKNGHIGSAAEIEFLNSSSGMRLYLNIFSLALPAEVNDPSKVLMDIIIGEVKYSILGERLFGGQRVLFPQEITQTILEALVNQQNVQIVVGRYYIEIMPDNFADIY